MISFKAFLLLPILSFACVVCWDSEDLEVFDVVEEVGENFYKLLDVPENANGSTIKKAFRKLSLILHPDKNDKPDAEIKFRQLVAVHDILKDSNKRAKYDEVLEHGLPDWKHAVFYYRRVRKMGLLELSIILFIIVTIGQYTVAWAAYFEKKYAVEEFVNFKSKIMQKRQKKGKQVDLKTLNYVLPELVSNIPTPSFSCTLPAQICRLTWFLIFQAPPLTVYWIKDFFERRKQRQKEMEEESSEEEVFVPKEKVRRRKPLFTTEIIDNRSNEIKAERASVPPSEEPPEPILHYGGIWTDDDLIALTKLTKKFPTGTSERWEQVGRHLNRPASEVAIMAHKLKSLKPILKEEVNTVPVEEVPKKVKTRGGKLGALEDQAGNWSQDQQKAFELALAVIPKSADERWEKIALAVPGKTKEECLLRYKRLAEIIKKRKQNPEGSPS